VKIGPIAALLAINTAALLSQQPSREQVGPTARRRFPPQQRLAHQSGWHADSRRHVPHGDGHYSRQKVPAGAERWFRSSHYQRDRYRVAKKCAAPPVPDAWLGLTMTKAGDHVYVGGGSRAAYLRIHSREWCTHAVAHMFPVVADKDRKPEDFIGDVQLSPDGHLLYAADLYRDSVVVVNPQSGIVLSRIKTGRRPYRISVPSFGQEPLCFQLGRWLDRPVRREHGSAHGQHPRGAAHHRHGLARARWKISPTLPRALRFGQQHQQRLCAGGNGIGRSFAPRNINLALTPLQPSRHDAQRTGTYRRRQANCLWPAPMQTMPRSWISPARAAACWDFRPHRLVSDRRVRSAGWPHGGAEWKRSADRMRIPGGQSAGWKPGARQKQLRARNTWRICRAAPCNSPTCRTTHCSQSYTEGSARQFALSRRKAGRSRHPRNNPVRPNGPIKHVIYIVKENRTYDQVLGDMKQGNGDASLTLFGEAVTPNLHKLAERVCATRQLLCEFRCQRRRSQLGDGGHRARLHAAHVAQSIRRASQKI
jgi:YVTN family beta-propeller protein